MYGEWTYCLTYIAFLHPRVPWGPHSAVSQCGVKLGTHRPGCSWCVLCSVPQVYELVTGQFLFEPHSSDQYSRDEGRLRLFSLPRHCYHCSHLERLLFYYRRPCGNDHRTSRCHSQAHCIEWGVLPGDIHQSRYVCIQSRLHIGAKKDHCSRC